MSSVAGSKSCLAGGVFCGRPFDPCSRSARRSAERSPRSIGSCSGSLENLALLYLVMGRRAEAEQLHKKLANLQDVDNLSS